MKEERRLVGDVPAMVYLPRNSKGLLLLGHGGGHSKDAPRFVSLARRYAEHVGLAVVCIDAVDHGERAAPAAEPGLPSGWHTSVMARMVDDWCSTATGLADLGPPLAYVGFSMGAIFGPATVAALPTIASAVFVVGGLPTGAWIDDPALVPALRDMAGRLEHADLLMLNTNDDELFSRADATALFEAVCARTKRLEFWPGRHDDWREELIGETVTFLNGILP